jgi:hypothetical protein
MKQPVAGHNGLYKDPTTGLIVNRESTERERYRIARNQSIRSMSTEYELQQMKGEIDEIKSLLQQLLNK